MMNSDDPDGWSFISGTGAIGPTTTPGMGETTTTGGLCFPVLFVLAFFFVLGPLAHIVARVPWLEQFFFFVFLATYPSRFDLYVLYGVCRAYILLFFSLIPYPHIKTCLSLRALYLNKEDKFNSDVGEE